MRLQTEVAALTIAFVVGWSGAVSAQPIAQPEEPAPEEPSEVEIVQALGQRIASLQDFRIEVVDTIDDVLENGQKVQYTHLRTARVSRPDRLVLETKGDLENRKLIKDADTVTLMDLDHQVYGQIKFSGTIDEMMDRLLERFGVSTPLADFLGGDSSAELLEGAYESDYLGLHRAGPHLSHHLAFRQDDMDWQAWVDAGDVPLLRKLVITYKNEAGAPQYTVQLKSLEIIEAPAADEAFVPQIPDGFEHIDILTIDGTGEPIEAESTQANEGASS
jgi:hypothetical protein